MTNHDVDALLAVLDRIAKSLKDHAAIMERKGSEITEQLARIAIEIEDLNPSKLPKTAYVSLIDPHERA